jgi:hypothetical protein
LSDDFDGSGNVSSTDNSNFDQAFDELISSPPKGPSANRSSLSSTGKRSSSKNSKSISQMSSDFLLSSSDSFSSPPKSPKPPKASVAISQPVKARTSISRGTFYTGLDQDTDDQSHSGSYSIFSESIGESVHRPSTTPDIGLKKGNIAAPSPVAGASRGGGNDSDFDFEDSILGNLIGENPKTRRSMGGRPSSATTTIRHPSPEGMVGTNARKPRNSFDETHEEKSPRPNTTGSIGSRGKVLDLDMLSGIYGKNDMMEHSFPDGKLVPANTPATSSHTAPMNTPMNIQSSHNKQMAYPSDDEAYQVSTIPGLLSRNSSGRNSPSLGLFEPTPAYESYPAGASTPIAGNYSSNPSSVPAAAANQLLVTPVNNQSATKNDGGDVDMAFVPSFLDPDRKTRSRR